MTDNRNAPAPAGAPDEEDEVKAGMVRRMNAMHIALAEVVATFENDSFNGQNTRYVVATDGPGGFGDDVRVGAGHTITAGTIRRAKRALSEAAYEVVSPSSAPDVTDEDVDYLMSIVNRFPPAGDGTQRRQIVLDEDDGQAIWTIALRLRNKPATRRASSEDTQ